tara:strand:- start:29 stop:529 length:501 start_codon:yes stop_codon:yes gene_type:complete
MNLEKWNERTDMVKEYIETDGFLLNEDAEDIKKVILHFINRECPLDADIELFRKKTWSGIQQLLSMDENYHSCDCGRNRTPPAIQKLLDDMRPHWVDFYNTVPLMATFYRKGRKEIKTYHLHDTAEEYADYQHKILRLKLMRMYEEGRIDITDDIITIVNEVNEDE